MKGKGAAVRRPYRVGVDVGGTFTDLVAVDEAGGTVHLVKRPTTPHDQSEGVAEGLVALLGAANISAGEVGYLGHGTTVCINAMLQRKGALTSSSPRPGCATSSSCAGRFGRICTIYRPTSRSR